MLRTLLSAICVLLPALATANYPAAPAATVSTSHDPAAAANPLSKATFSYLNPMLKLGSRRPLEEADLPSLLPRGSRHAVLCGDRTRVPLAMLLCLLTRMRLIPA